MALDLFVIFNNYFHDMATGVLVGSTALMYALAKRARENPERLAALASLYPVVTKVAKVALAWVIIGGVPRVIFFTRYEWDPATVKGIVPALGIKHVLLFSAVGAGLVLWRRAKSALGLSEDGSGAV